jgi:hypothetical protein
MLCARLYVQDRMKAWIDNNFVYSIDGTISNMDNATAEIHVTAVKQQANVRADKHTTECAYVILVHAPWRLKKHKLY